MKEKKYIGQLFNSYNAVNLNDFSVPLKSQVDFTISQLKSEFGSLISISSNDKAEIIINDEVLDGFSAIPPNFNNHQSYINDIGYHINKVYMKDL